MDERKLNGDEKDARIIEFRERRKRHGGISIVEQVKQRIHRVVDLGIAEVLRDIDGKPRAY